MRIVLHAGFHKTGTSSVQAALAAHRAALAPQVHVETRALSRRFAAVCEAARAVSLHPGYPAPLVAALAPWTARLPDCETLLISSEDLCGHMPGRFGLTDYRAALVTLPCITDALRARFAAADLRVLITTRAAGDWLRSLHWQLSKHPDLRLTLRAFRRQHGQAADFAAVLGPLQAVLAPVPLAHAALAPHPLGPVAALYDLAGLPDSLQRHLPAVPPQTRSTPLDLADAFVRLNRAGLPPDELDRIKHEMVTLARMVAEDGATPLSSAPAID